MRDESWRKSSSKILLCQNFLLLLPADWVDSMCCGSLKIIVYYDLNRELDGIRTPVIEVSLNTNSGFETPFLLNWGPGRYQPKQQIAKMRQTGTYIWFKIYFSDIHWYVVNKALTIYLCILFYICEVLQSSRLPIWLHWCRLLPDINRTFTATVPTGCIMEYVGNVAFIAASQVAGGGMGKLLEVVAHKCLPETV